MILINSKAQGTIEYLVILAVIVVISLIVVALFTGIFSSPSQQIVDSSSKLGASTSGGISVVDSVIDSQGNALVRLSNLSSDNVSLVKISAGGVDTEPLSNQLVGLAFGDFNLNNLGGVCPCEVGQKSVNCNLIIEYTIPPQTTIHTVRQTINAECVGEVSVVNPNKVVQPIVPVLELGTLANPWIIDDCHELQDMNQHLDGNYILGNDIDCSDTVNWNFVAAHCSSPGYENKVDCESAWEVWFPDFGGFYPIGADIGENSFRGSFDGANYSISGLTIYGTYYAGVGLFGTNEGTVSNVNLVNINYNINDLLMVSSVGSLVGFNRPTGVLSNSTSSGTIIDPYGLIMGGVGQIVGYNVGTVTNCSSTVVLSES